MTDVTGFIKERKNGELKSLYFIMGAENYLIDAAVKAVAADPAFGDAGFNVSRFDKTSQRDEIEEAVFKAPFFSDRRLVIVKDCQYFASAGAKEREKLIAVLDDIPETTTVIFTFFGTDDLRKAESLKVTRIDKRNALYKKLMKDAFLITADPLGPDVLKKWLISSAKKQGVRLTSVTADRMLAICDSSMYGLLSEIDKLRNTGIPEPGYDDITDTVSHTTDYNIFVIQDSMYKRQYKKAFDVIDQVWADDRSFIGLTSALAGKFRLLYMAKRALMAGSSQYKAEESLIKIGGAAPYPAKLAVREAGQFPLEALEKSFRLILEQDIKQKSEVISPEDFKVFMLRLYRGL